MPWNQNQKEDFVSPLINSGTRTKLDFNSSINSSTRLLQTTIISEDGSSVFRDSDRGPLGMTGTFKSRISSSRVLPNLDRQKNPTSQKSLNPLEMHVEVPVPTEDDVFMSKRLQDLADQLAHSLVLLRTQVAQMEQRIRFHDTKAILPYQVRRAISEKAQLETEIKRTDRTIKRLLIMSSQIDQLVNQRKKFFDDYRRKLEVEIETLSKQKEMNVGAIRDGYVERINILQRYWPWRQLRELGDTTVGSTFEEELARGPRYRNVGLQNSIQSDYIAHQLRWLETFAEEEDTFREHMRRLDNMVEDLNDINDLIEGTLTCGVCGLLFEDPVIFWPCGHSFCLICFDTLTIAPSLFRCPVCGSIGTEGYAHNLLISETVAKWMFKDAGYGDIQGSLNSIRLHLSRFRKDRVVSKIDALKEMLFAQTAAEGHKSNSSEQEITISYRAY